MRACFFFCGHILKYALSGYAGDDCGIESIVLKLMQNVLTYRFTDDKLKMRFMTDKPIKKKNEGGEGYGSYRIGRGTGALC